MFAAVQTASEFKALITIVYFSCYLLTAGNIIIAGRVFNTCFAEITIESSKISCKTKWFFILSKGCVCDPS
jgi:hypothetical protein